VLFDLFLAHLFAEPAPLAVASHAVCPLDMRFVEGVHYEYVQRLCTDWRMDHCFAMLPGLLAKEPRVTPIRACMDTYEWPNQKGVVPAVMDRFVDAEAKCAGAGKRLCTEFEWEMACEGPETLPWPYGWQKDRRRATRRSRTRT